MNWMKTDKGMHTAETELGALVVIGGQGFYRIQWWSKNTTRFVIVARDIRTASLAKQVAETWFTTGQVNGVRIGPEGI